MCPDKENPVGLVLGDISKGQTLDYDKEDWFGLKSEPDNNKFLPILRIPILICYKVLIKPSENLH